MADIKRKPTVEGKEPKSEVVLATKDWIWLISLIVGGCVSMIGSLHYQSSHLTREMQDMYKELKLDIDESAARLEAKIPPDWFRKMVEANQSHIRDLESQSDLIERRLVRIEASLGMEEFQ